MHQGTQFETERCYSAAAGKDTNKWKPAKRIYQDSARERYLQTKSIADGNCRVETREEAHWSHTAKLTKRSWVLKLDKAAPAPDRARKIDFLEERANKLPRKGKPETRKLESEIEDQEPPWSGERAGKHWINLVWAGAVVTAKTRRSREQVQRDAAELRADNSLSKKPESAAGSGD